MDLLAHNPARLRHALARIQVAIEYTNRGYKAEFLEEPSSADLIIWKEGEIRFIEVKTGKGGRTTPNEDKLHKTINSRPVLKYELVKRNGDENG